MRDITKITYKFFKLFNHGIHYLVQTPQSSQKIDLNGFLKKEHTA